MLLNNTCRYVYYFRQGLMRELKRKGFEVVVGAPRDDDTDRLTQFGVRWHELPMGNSLNPIIDFKLVIAMLLFLRKESPDFVLTFTHKPNIYGSIAAKILGIPVLNNISGLGAPFIRENWVTGILIFLYQFSLKYSQKIFFQNGDDRDLFLKLGIAQEGQAGVLPGSGVNLTYYSSAKILEPRYKKNYKFLLCARMLRDKGIVEYAMAAQKIKERYPNQEFFLLGAGMQDNPAAISDIEIKAWESTGALKYLGAVDDVRDVMGQMDCVVLPSYREGTPRSLLEAASMGKPIITTDAVGCREVVNDGENGFLCKIGDSKDLARKLEQFILLDIDQIALMGKKSREIAVKKFDENFVVSQYMKNIMNLQVPAVR